MSSLRRIMLVLTLNGLTVIAGLSLIACSTPEEGVQETTTSTIEEGTAPEEEISTGEEAATEETETEVPDYEAKLRMLNEMGLKVEVWEDGEKTITWTQKKPNWKAEEPDGTQMVLYKGDEKKLYLVDLTEKTAVVMPAEGAEEFMMMSPLHIAQTFKDLPWTVQTGDTWTAVAEDGTVEAKFEGPQGLMTQLKFTDPDATTYTIEFRYLNVGDVADSEFDLPSDISVQELPSEMMPETEESEQG